jgi:predicted enzyme related to lactoylglutathione lyase
MMTKPPFLPVAMWNYYFRVDSVDAAVERIKAAGGTVTNGPMEVPSGDWIVQGTDPQGAAFSLLSAQR